MVLETMRLITPASRLPPFYYVTKLQNNFEISKFFRNFFHINRIIFRIGNNLSLFTDKGMLLRNKGRLFRDKKGTKGSDPFVPFYCNIALQLVLGQSGRKKLTGMIYYKCLYINKLYNNLSIIYLFSSSFNIIRKEMQCNNAI